MRKRVIPVLSLLDSGLVKTTRFKDPKYVGDPINAVKIFNRKEVDELVFLDISPNRASKGPNYSQIKEIASEAFMPFGYGGGITQLDQAERLFSLGVEKVIVNSAFWKRNELVSEISEKFGAQSVVVSIDVRKKLFGGLSVFSENGKTDTGLSPLEAALLAEKCGAGEVFLNFIDREGTLEGFNLDLIRAVGPKLSIPLIASGGGNSIENFALAFKAGADAVAAGAFFVFQGKHRAVLITYPGEELNKIFY